MSETSDDETSQETAPIGRQELDRKIPAAVGVPTVFALVSGTPVVAALARLLGYSMWFGLAAPILVFAGELWFIRSVQKRAENGDDLVTDGGHDEGAHYTECDDAAPPEVHQ